MFRFLNGDADKEIGKPSINFLGLAFLNRSGTGITLSKSSSKYFSLL